MAERSYLGKVSNVTIPTNIEVENAVVVADTDLKKFTVSLVGFNLEDLKFLVRSTRTKDCSIYFYGEMSGETIIKPEFQLVQAGKDPFWITPSRYRD